MFKYELYILIGRRVSASRVTCRRVPIRGAHGVRSFNQFRHRKQSPLISRGRLLTPTGEEAIMASTFFNNKARAAAAAASSSSKAKAADNKEDSTRLQPWVEK